MPEVGMPLENPWSRWPGRAYQLPVQCWVGPHHSAVITGIARAGLDALIELAGGKQPRGRPVGLLCDSPQVQDAVGRADAILNAGRAYRSTMISELWNTLASGKETTLGSGPAAAWPRAIPPTARARRWTWCTGTAAAPRSSAKAGWPNAGATCTPSARRLPSP